MSALSDGAFKAYAEFDVTRLHQAHWIMDLASWRQLMAEYGFDDGTGPGKWTPGPDATLLGLPIEVTDDGGQPRLVVD